MKTSIVIGALVLSSSVMAQTTKIDNGNGETTTITTTKEKNTTIERGVKETNNETHKEAVERVKKEYQDKGEKATVIK